MYFEWASNLFSASNSIALPEALVFQEYTFPLLLATTKRDPSTAIDTDRTGTSSSGISSCVQAFSVKSQIFTLPD